MYKVIQKLFLLPMYLHYSRRRSNNLHVIYFLGYQAFESVGKSLAAGSLIMLKEGTWYSFQKYFSHVLMKRL